MSKQEIGLLIASVAIVALLVGGIYSVSRNTTPAPAATNLQTAPSQSAATETAPDPALCGNGVVDAGEDCDPLDPLTAFDVENGKECQMDCTMPLYSDPMECMDARHMEFCVDADDNPVADYYDCVDEQHYHCEGLTY